MVNRPPWPLIIARYDRANRELIVSGVGDKNFGLRNDDNRCWKGLMELYFEEADFKNDYIYMYM